MYTASKSPTEIAMDEFTDLGRCEIAQAGIGAIDGSLLDNAVARFTVAQVIWPQAILAIKHTPVDEIFVWFFKRSINKRKLGKLGQGEIKKTRILTVVRRNLA